MTKRRPTVVRLDLMTEEQLRDAARARIAGREHWTLPWIGRTAVRLSVEIENRFYLRGGAADFDLFTMPSSSGVFACSFFAKRRLPAARLNALLAECGNAPPVEAGGDRDILAPFADDADLERARRFACWLEGGA
jgi:hypothetical protein